MAHQLTLEERERISQMRYARFTNAEIAEELGRHRATISRELARNSVAGDTGPWRLTSSRVSGATAEGWYGRWIGPRWTSLCGAIWCITGHPTRLRGDRSVTFPARVAGRCRTRRSMPGSTRNRAPTASILRASCGSPGVAGLAMIAADAFPARFRSRAGHGWSTRDGGTVIGREIPSSAHGSRERS